MPVIIWGSRGLSKTVSHGQFDCPRCGHQSEYSVIQVREWFTLYWIPIFPVGSAKRYLECRNCGQTFDEDVLQQRPSGSSRMLNQVYRDLETGTSLQEGEEQLQRAGMSADEANDAIVEMASGDNWRCEKCGRNYLRVVKSCRRCQGSYRGG